MGLTTQQYGLGPKQNGVQQQVLGVLNAVAPRWLTKAQIVGLLPHEQADCKSSLSHVNIAAWALRREGKIIAKRSSLTIKGTTPYEYALPDNPEASLALPMEYGSSRSAAPRTPRGKHNLAAKAFRSASVANALEQAIHALGRDMQKAIADRDSLKEKLRESNQRITNIADEQAKIASVLALYKPVPEAVAQ